MVNWTIFHLLPLPPHKGHLARLETFLVITTGGGGVVGWEVLASRDAAKPLQCTGKPFPSNKEPSGPKYQQC